jgi:hypothetical protein
MLALFALAVVMANIQGAVAPFASLLPLLMEGTPMPASPIPWRKPTSNCPARIGSDSEAWISSGLLRGFRHLRGARVSQAGSADVRGRP